MATWATVSGSGSASSQRRTVRRGSAALGVVAALLAGCGGPGSARTAATAPSTGVASPVPSGALLPQAALGEPRVVADDLAVPWAIDFLPTGDALVTERDTAHIERVTARGDIRQVATVRGVHPGGEGGLLGIAVSPRFRSDRTVYVYYTAAADDRVVALHMGSDGRVDGAHQRILVSGIPKGQIHNGGRLEFGPDGYLYVSTGEAGRGEPAQDRGDLGGKILRITADGAPAPGNPFGSRVYTYGHRNVQGMAWGPDGRMFATEFGQNRFDEINRIRAGSNYGWPDIEGYRKGTQAPQHYRDPLLTWTPSQASPSGLAYAGGSLWAAALRGARLWRIPIGSDGGLGRPQALYQQRFGRLRAVVATPDGSALWVTTSNKDGRGSPHPGDDKIIAVPLR